MKAILFGLALALTHSLSSLHAAGPVFQEKDGLVVIEAESTASLP